ncbi:MAG: hypothetical protein H0U99_04725 [Chthoniobacterales bacterium]|nr:hypothetical protein [Chthoniobacterales bacterium]
MTKCILFLLLLGVSVPACFAGARRFTYNYEAMTAAPGGFEFENWVTWKTSKPDDRSFNEVDFRHEIEFGLTDRLQAAIYLADWNYAEGKSVDDPGFMYTASALELVYNLTNPVADPLGLSFYQEIRAGRRVFESESKLIAQKNVGRFAFVYNATLEATWEGRGLDDRAGEIQQSLGASYEVNPRLFIGAECLHEIELPEWKRPERGFFFAGPNASVRSGRFWATATALAQLTNAGGEPDFQLRTIFGVAF